MSIAPEPRMSPCPRCNRYFCECSTVEPFGLVALGMHGVDDAGVDHPLKGMSDEEAMLAMTDRVIDLEQALRILVAALDAETELDNKRFASIWPALSLARATLAAAPGASAENARLIAAAPALLEALLSIWSRPADVSQRGAWIKWAKEQADAAIEKATGEATR